ncbi:MAG: class I mannose-6-phosphate isomerase [Hassallia sp. WJT32-NPBG1]|jgi:mannose-6-phosphate isomerase|nr:class I mannose-6-phosphate isomerase [Hassallia sp. WJT32-NPBG1]
MNWYPIKLSAHINTYVFGGRLIKERLGKGNLPDGTVAETWEISDYQDKSGTVTNGEFADRTLHDLVEAHPDELVGEGWRGPHFPILQKFIDASGRLPIHLHPDDETAQRLYSEPNGKTEAWYILWAAPSASILAGIKPGLTREQLFDAFKKQDYDAVMPRFPIKAGDTVYVPSGVIHSFGPDTLIFEVEQTSDLAEDVMPSDMQGNSRSEDEWEKCINATLDELRTHYQPRPNAGLLLREGANRYVLTCAGPYFALERWTLTEAHIEPDHPWRCMTISNVATPVRIEYRGGSETLATGESCIIPAALSGVRIVPTQPQEGAASLIVCYVPDLERDIVTPLRKVGHSDEEIRALGEVGI